MLGKSTRCQFLPDWTGIELCACSLDVILFVFSVFSLLLKSYCLCVCVGGGGGGDDAFFSLRCTRVKTCLVLSNLMMFKSF